VPEYSVTFKITSVITVFTAQSAVQ